MYMNIVDAIIYQCRLNPTSTAIVAPGGQIHVITYAGLERMLNSLTHVVLSLGIEPQDVVGISVEDRVFHIGLVLALTRLGVINISFGDHPIPKQLGVKATIADRAIAAENAGRVIRADPRWISNDERPPTDRRPDQTSSCRLFLTSASTDAAKVVALSQNAMIARNANLDFAHGSRFPRCTRLHCDMDLTDATASCYISYVLMRGGTVLLRGGSTADTETSKTVYRMEHMVTSAQSFGRHVNFFRSEKIFQCELDHVVVLGEPMSRELAAEGREYMTPNIISCYGTIETGPVAAADSRKIADFPGAVGYVLPGATVEIVDASQQRLPPSAEGLVRLRTDTMAEEYFRDPEQTGLSFANGFFYPGEHGTLSDDGLLVLTGL
jgi:acyl-CoA synthetase (AMP-forming)/AMP-acid ligase II